MKHSKPIVGMSVDLKDAGLYLDRRYAEATARAGGIPFLIPVSSSKSLIKDTLEKIDGLIISGGRDINPKFYEEKPHPKLRPLPVERTEYEILLLSEALEHGIPVLGICGGMQLINIFFGGTLYQDISSEVPNALLHEKGTPHEVYVEKETLLESITKKSSFFVMSYHHQSVRTPGKNLRISATSSDGVAEALESSVDSSFLLGIQWHPEREKGGISSKIFEFFVGECKERQVR